MTGSQISWRRTLRQHGVGVLGNGDGTFQTNVNYGTGSGPSSVAIGDVSGDGKLDLVTTSSTLPILYVLLGNGDGTFQTPEVQRDTESVQSRSPSGT